MSDSSRSDVLAGFRSRCLPSGMTLGPPTPIAIGTEIWLMHDASRSSPQRVVGRSPTSRQAGALGERMHRLERLSLPVVIVFDWVVHGFVLAAVDAEVRMSVTIKVEPAQHDAAFTGCLKMAVSTFLPCQVTPCGIRCSVRPVVSRSRNRFVTAVPRHCHRCPQKSSSSSPLVY